MEKLSVIIPAFNEQATLNRLLQRVYEADIGNLNKEVVVIDDASTDGTYGVLQAFLQAHPDLEMQSLQHEANMGKGAALRTGISAATGDYIVVQDADLEYDPSELKLLLKPILEGFADVVYGSRFMGGKPHRILFFWHSIGNRLLTFLSNMFTNLNLTDMETCYKMWKSDIIQSITLRENRFGFEPEVTAKVSRIPNVRIYEIGISYYGRSYQEGKKINWKDGFKAIYCILKYNIWSR